MTKSIILAVTVIFTCVASSNAQTGVAAIEGASQPNVFPIEQQLFTNEQAVKDWFEKYDLWRSNHFITYEENFRVLSNALSDSVKVLFDPDPRSWIGLSEIAHDNILNDRSIIEYDSYAIKNLRSLPDLPATQELKNGWLNYLTTGQDLLTKYANAYQNRKKDPDTWETIKSERPLKEKQLRALADQNYHLENSIRKLNKFPEKRYKKAPFGRWKSYRGC
jgi:hypothetical protein